MFGKAIVRGLLAAAMVCCAVVAQAVDIDLVPIDKPSNGGDYLSGIAYSALNPGPTISGVMVSELDQPRDGVLTRNERLVISWHADDADGVTNAAINVDGDAITAINGPYATPSGVNFNAWLGTRSAGMHSYAITAKDSLGNSGLFAGFFSVNVPEPGCLVMLAGIALTAVLCWWRKRA